jgi:hypothetical protein
MTNWIVITTEEISHGFVAYGPFHEEDYNMEDRAKFVEAAYENYGPNNMGHWEQDLEMPAGDNTGYDPNGPAAVFAPSLVGGLPGLCCGWSFFGPFRDLDAAKAWADHRGVQSRTVSRTIRALAARRLALLGRRSSH